MSVRREITEYDGIYFITSNKFIDQKLEYIHANPCRGIWNLVNEEYEYKHSSAKFYLTGKQGVYAVTNYAELEDIDLAKAI